MSMEDLELVAYGVVEGALHGLHRSPYIGSSVEFDAHRDYQFGDDLRYVNWNLWGRTDRLYIKQFKADTNLNLYLLLDTSGSMLTDHGPTEKWRYGARAIAALSFLSLHTRDATGLFLLQDHIQGHVPPRVRPGQFHEILATLGEANPTGSTDIARSLEETLELCRRRGIVLLISDLFDNEDEILRSLSALRYYGHEVIVVHLLDPWEHALPSRGQYEFRDLETGETVRAHAGSLRESYGKLVGEWRDRLRKRCEDAGIDWLTCDTTTPLRELLITYLLKRATLH